MRTYHLPISLFNKCDKKLSKRTNSFMWWKDGGTNPKTISHGGVSNPLNPYYCLKRKRASLNIQTKRSKNTWEFLLKGTCGVTLKN